MCAPWKHTLPPLIEVLLVPYGVQGALQGRLSRWECLDMILR